MKKNLKFPVVAALTLALTSPVMAQSNFPDVNSNEWYANAIANAVNNGLLGGYEDGTMRPQGFVTRAEIATIFGKAFATTQKASLESFPDVNYNDWYYVPMAKAVNMGIFTGDHLGNLNPNMSITREEVAVVVTKAFELEHSGKDVLSKFADKENVSSWASSYVSALVENGYMSGYNKGNLNPKGKITRAEFAQIMSNISNNYISEKGDVSGNYEGTVIVKVPDVVMKNSTITGDLVIADGVGTGDFTLDNVKIDGNVIIRGGGTNSIKIINNSDIMGKVILRNPNGKTRIHADGAIESVVEINSPVIIDATCENVIVNSSADVEVKGKVETMEVNAENVNISGKGDIKTVNANANDVVVTVKDANVVVAENVTGVVAGTKDVAAGESAVVKTTGGSGGGGGGGNAPVSPTVKTLAFEIKDDGTYFSIVGDGDFSTKFSNTVYDVTVTGAITKSGRITSGADAFTFAKEILGSLSDAQINKLLVTLDHKKEVDGEGFFTKDNYDEYRSLLKTAGILLGDARTNYDALIAAEEEYYTNIENNIENVSFVEFYSLFKEKGNNQVSLKGLIDEIGSMGDEVTTLLGNLYGEGFVQNLLD